MHSLSKEELRAAEQKATRVGWVPLPHLGEDSGVHVRSLSAYERAQFEAEMRALDDRRRHMVIRASFVALCACDESGKSLFDNPDEAGEFNQLTVQCIWDGARKFNSMYLDEDEKRALEKNSEAPTDGSTTK